MKTEKLIDIEEKETLMLDPEQTKFAKAVVKDLRHLKNEYNNLTRIIFITFIVSIAFTLTVFSTL